MSPAPTSTEAPSLEARLDVILGTGFNGSALVSKDGKALYAKGLGMAEAATNLPSTPETRFRIGSITKQFTAMAILILESRGLVAQGDPVCDYVETCPKGWEAIKIEHLLAHTSGIANFTDQAGFDGMRAATPAETVASVAEIPLKWTPGKSFSYTNTGYVLLGMVIEQVSGTTYEAFLQDEIFEPLGMKDSGYEHGDTPGLATGYSEGFTVAGPLDMSVPYAAGGLYSTVLDLQRWVEAISTDRLAPTAEMARFAAPIAETTDQTGFAYGYGQVVGDDHGSRVVWHNGGINGFYTQLARYPDDHVSIVLLTNRESSPDLWPLAQAIKRTIEEGP
jgi:CubicO group peptidase (beta-lactamase class C family)